MNIALHQAGERLNYVDRSWGRINTIRWRENTCHSNNTKVPKACYYTAVCNGHKVLVLDINPPITLARLTVMQSNVTSSGLMAFEQIWRYHRSTHSQLPLQIIMRIKICYKTVFCTHNPLTQTRLIQQILCHHVHWEWTGRRLRV